MDIIGHRGAKGEAPENTLSGFRYLMAMGLRQVEFDIHVSADGQLMVASVTCMTASAICLVKFS